MELETGSHSDDDDVPPLPALVRLPFTGRTIGQVEKQLQAEGVRRLSTDLQEKPQS